MAKSSVEELPVEKRADFQIVWKHHIETLKPNKFDLIPLTETRIVGDAPKNLLRLKDPEVAPLRWGDFSHNKGKFKKNRRGPANPSFRANDPATWPTYIAKVGSKFYPIESVTEHLITRVGQLAGIEIANSRLALVGTQVRFLSEFFLLKGEWLWHGQELLGDEFGTEEMQRVRKKRSEELRLFSFQNCERIVRKQFPNEADNILSGFVSMLAFDALVGNNDRHNGNWAIIMSPQEKVSPCFSPVYDTARALFWNTEEDRLPDPASSSFNAQIETYALGSGPRIGWEGEKTTGFTHFDLCGHLCRNEVLWRASFEILLAQDLVFQVAEVAEKEFGPLLSKRRRECILRLIRVRQQHLEKALNF